MKKLEIELKNGENLVLEVTPLFFEYIEDYEGGIEQLQEDAETTYALNQMLYAIIASNYDETLTYKQAVRLVKIEDMERIIKFINEELPSLNEQNTAPVNRRRHRK